MLSVKTEMSFSYCESDAPIIGLKLPSTILNCTMISSFVAGFRTNTFLVPRASRVVLLSYKHSEIFRSVFSSTQSNVSNYLFVCVQWQNTARGTGVDAKLDVDFLP